MTAWYEMKAVNSLFRSLSWWAMLSVIVVAFGIRFTYFTNNSKNGYNATTWDALGYYMYLPGLIIYDDVTELKWFPEMDKKYQMSGGELYQATKQEKGGYVFKYLGGVSIMQLPFFLAGHAIAYMTDAPEDGFSWPYQYAIIFGAVFWFSIGVFFLRKVLLRFYSETVAAVTILLVALASNLLQYVSVEGAMSHAFIFPLYAIVLWLTIRWHESPKAFTALLIGIICGLAVISRPTELIILFIPLLWSLETTGKLKSKWQLVRANRLHIVLAVTGGIIGVLPQLIYWKYTTGSFVYDVGSKWYFLNPWWRVLVGFEKGWFIYTPIAIFMVAGLFFMKGKPFRKSVLTFCLLNIWIIISWSDWRYGASYSTRALTQSYPVFALALAALIERIIAGKWRIAAAVAGIYFVFVNLFQIGQYNNTVLHYDHMNFSYYKAIYLDWSPTPMDYSLLDSGNVLTDGTVFMSKKQLVIPEAVVVAGKPLVLQTVIGNPDVRYAIDFESDETYKTGVIAYRVFHRGSCIRERKFRLAVPKSKPGKLRYEAYIRSGIWKQRPDSVQLSVETFSELRLKDLKALFSYR